MLLYLERAREKTVQDVEKHSYDRLAENLGDVEVFVRADLSLNRLLHGPGAIQPDLSRRMEENR